MSQHQSYWPPTTLANPGSEMEPMGTPLSLKTATAAALLSFIAALSISISVLTTGKAWLKDEFTKAIGGTELPRDLVDSTLSNAYTTLEHRAYVWMFIGAIAIIITFVGRKGSRWAAALSLLLFFLVAGMATVELGDEVQTLTKLLSIVTTMAAFISVVGYWLPSTRRFARQRSK